MMPTSRRSVSRCRYLIATLAVAPFLGGCATMQGNRRVDKEQRWDSVRGRVQYQLADKQFAGGRFEEAERTAIEALALDPGHAPTYILLARAQLEQGRLAAAEQTVTLCAEAGLSTPSLRYTQGVILEQRGNAEDALGHYAAAVEADPRNEDFLIAWAETLVTLSREKEALAGLDAAMDKVNDRAAVGALAAQIALLTGDRDGALARYRQAGISPGDEIDLAGEFGLLLARARRCSEAQPYLERTITAAEEDAAAGSARRALAKCFLESDQPARGRALLADYARRNPSDTGAQLLLAKSALATNDILTALEAVSAAERHEGRRPEVRFVRAVVLWKRGEYAGAERVLRELTTEVPNDVDVHCLLGEVLLKLGETEAAREEFREALRLNADATWAAQALRSLERVSRATPNPPALIRHPLPAESPAAAGPAPAVSLETPP